MKKIGFVIAAASIMVLGCGALKENTALLRPESNPSSTNSLTNEEVVSGLKEALSVGVQNAVSVTSVKDGFLENAKIKLPFPPSAEKMRQRAMDWGMESQVDQIVTTLNRAAEDAAGEAAPIFLNAVKNMSVNDGFKILNGGDGAATEFLRRQTTKDLIVAFSPKVEESIKKVKLTEYWNPVASRYNKAARFTSDEPVDDDLNRYVTERAVDGLFLMVEQEENKIRKDPKARVTKTLEKVFGNL